MAGQDKPLFSVTSASRGAIQELEWVLCLTNTEAEGRGPVAKGGHQKDMAAIDSSTLNLFRPLW